MSHKIEIALALIIVSVCFWGLYKTVTGLNGMTAKHYVQLVNKSPELQLKPTEQERFLVTPHHVTTISRDAKGQTVVHTDYVPSRATITVQNDGQVIVKNKTFGLTVEPQLGVAYSDSLRAVLGAKVAYFDRLGLNAGISLRAQRAVDPKVFISLSCVVASNTSAFVGVQNDKKVIAGVQVRL